MAYDIDQILSHEIRKEIAERYFGFRKIIEEDKDDLAEKVRQETFILEKRISFDLVRIYVLLAEPELIESFLKGTGLDSRYFYDPFLKESKLIRARVFEGVRPRGFTRRRRFINLLIDCYERLDAHVEHYRIRFSELMELRSVIAEEIRLFYRQNDLGSIIGFMRSMGRDDCCGGLAGGMERGIADELEKKMRIEPPLPVEQYLPVVAPFPEPARSRKMIKRLAAEAWAVHRGAGLEDCLGEGLLSRLLGRTGKERRADSADG